jgi:hypothetical protein
MAGVREIALSGSQGRTLRREAMSLGTNRSREADDLVLVKTGKSGAWNGTRGASVKCGERKLVIVKGGRERAASLLAPYAGEGAPKAFASRLAGLSILSEFAM